MRHGHALAGQTSKTYDVWKNMLGRVRGYGVASIKNYTSRGITVCARWLSFENFLADMGERPAGMSIDRVNNDGNYEPGNCRWATVVEQLSNRRPYKKKGATP